jgi:uncharacterized protein
MTEVTTPSGPATIELDAPAGPARAVLALGHGAGGGVNAPDILAVRDAVVAAGLVVVRITQPYRVAGRRAPAPARQLDAAWVAALAALTSAGTADGELIAARTPLTAGAPLFVGGRSSGARVACRTADAVDAAGIVVLAFPVHPPGRPERSRLPELDTGRPTLAVSGERDPFGVPPPAPGRDVVIIPSATHDLRRDPPGVAAAVVAWLNRMLAGRPGRDAVDPAGTPADPVRPTRP